MDEPVIAKYKPYYYELEAGKSYLWCSCGRSNKQPFCDGAHKGTHFKPVKYVGQSAGEEVLFCGCKHSEQQPFCDGAHNNLSDTYALADAADEALLRTLSVARTPNQVAQLNNRCYVSHPRDKTLSNSGSLSWCQLIGPESGAQHQSQYYLKQGRGTSPFISFGDAECAMLVTGGSGQIEIGSVRFDISLHAGVYVRTGEAFCLTNTCLDPLEIYITICPQSSLQLHDIAPGTFDRSWPDRVMHIDTGNAQTMGDRFFQILVGKNVGSSLITEFIGDIPRSKAAMHRHLYEETLVILQGAGTFWTEDLKTNVRVGDVIFLPRKQIHSLECTSEEGMRLAGVIYPGDNPAINY